MAVPSTLTQARPLQQQPMTRDEAWVVAGVAGAGALILLLTLRRHTPASSTPPAVGNGSTLPPIQTGPGDSGAPPGDCGCG